MERKFSLRVAGIGCKIIKVEQVPSHLRKSLTMRIGIMRHQQTTGTGQKDFPTCFLISRRLFLQRRTFEAFRIITNILPFHFSSSFFLYLSFSLSFSFPFYLTFTWYGHVSIFNFSRRAPRTKHGGFQDRWPVFRSLAFWEIPHSC